MKSVITMWSADRRPTRCKCLTVGIEEPCKFYQISDDIKNRFGVDESNGPIATCPQCGSYDTEWVIDDDYNYNKCHACGWSSAEDSVQEVAKDEKEEL
jgi:Zn ribbon nucleic-acid-binding protein